MAKSSAKHCCGPRSAIAGNVCVLILGLIVAVFSIISDPDFYLVADLVSIETRRGGSEFNLHVMRTVTIFLGIVSVNLALVGIGAIANESAGLISCYTISYIILFVVFEALSLSSLQFQTNILPVISDQSDMYCNATLMPTLSAELGCHDALPADVVPNCGPECENYAEDLRAYGGCDLLQDLCHDMVYVDVGVGFCLLANDTGTFVRPKMWLLEVDSLSATDCQSKCSDTIDCIGFTYSETQRVCMYVLSLGRTNDEDWQPWDSDGAHVDEWEYMAADEQAGYECQAKDHANIADVAQRMFAFDYAMFAIMAAVLIAAAMCGCTQQYTLVTGRQGKKGFLPLAGKLLCPCTGRQRRRRFDNEDEDEETELVDG